MIKASRRECQFGIVCVLFECQVIKGAVVGFNENAVC